jgi:hypothetical protein
VAGRYLAPYLQESFESKYTGAGAAPSGVPVELDLERELEQAAEELRAGAQATVGRDA